ncbi:class I SAM-dependent methyltransferase [Austwickia chelonae]|uniref:class I SAM-dependent methyltransferase n=1 Tax=Austwickia chelonae TaxID=100225 RepID=UPI000E24C28F|nr:class I SAM-dependent methyltransferase [Austwickia chelonae]
MDEREATLASYNAGVAEYLRLTPEEPSALAFWLGTMVGDVFAPGARVWEIGSAGGQDARHLRECGLEVLASDAATAFVDHLHENGFPEAFRYDLQVDDPPLSDVDIVFANAVLPHLRRDEVGPALARVQSAVGDDVVLFASVKLGDGEGWSTEKLSGPRWYTYWQPEEFTRVLQSSGWVVEEARARAGRYDDWLAVIALPTRSALRDAFDERAASYCRSDFHRIHAERLVEETPLVPGTTVVDAAAGTGFVARAAGRRIGPDGRVIAVDLSEGMLQSLATGDDVDAAPIEVVVGDAVELDLPDQAVDAVLCSGGLLYMDVDLALSEWHRVISSGGVVSFSTMAAENPPPSLLFRVHARGYGLDIADPYAPLGTPEACTAALERAGFVDVQVTAGEVPLSDRDLDQTWEVYQRMARHDLATLPDADVWRLRASYVAEMTLRSRSDLEFRTGRALYATGRRP